MAPLSRATAAKRSDTTSTGPASTFRASAAGSLWFERFAFIDHCHAHIPTPSLQTGLQRSAAAGSRKNDGLARFLLQFLQAQQGFRIVAALWYEATALYIS